MRQPYRCKNAFVHDDMQHGLTFQKASAPFEMSVLSYSAYELENAMHPDELPSVRYTWVRIAAKQMGVGGDDSWVHRCMRSTGSMQISR